ncbi:hypothetical protein D3C87_405690 [compost metagenome]
MRPQVSKGPKWDQRLDARWKSLPRRVQLWWIWCSLALYVLVALLVFFEARREFRDKDATDYGTIRNPVTETVNKLEIKDNDRKQGQQARDLRE